MRRAKKLCRQFGLASKEKLKRLIEDTYGQKERKEDMEGCKREIDKVCKNCETCIKFKRSLERLVVGFPLRSVFNEMVAMDVGELGRKKFLVRIDLATHYCQGGWIKN